MDWLSVCCFVGAIVLMEKGYNYRHPLFGQWKTRLSACFGRPLCLVAWLLCWAVALGLSLKGCNVTWTQVTSFLASL